MALVPLAPVEFSPTARGFEAGELGGLVVVDGILPDYGFGVADFVGVQKQLGKVMNTHGAGASVALRGEAETVDFGAETDDDLRLVGEYAAGRSEQIWALRFMCPRGISASYLRTNERPPTIAFQWQGAQRELGSIVAKQVLALHRHPLNGATPRELQNVMDSVLDPFTGEVVGR